MNSLDDSLRYESIKAVISRKALLQSIYDDVYDKYHNCLMRSPVNGIALELGSGAGFTKKRIPEILTSDIIPYKGIDKVVDATRMPFPNDSLRCICMFNVFHHISDVDLFLKEAQRCLVQGGRVFIVDQHPGLFGYPIYKYFHHEYFDQSTVKWSFNTSGPLSNANGALAWIVFQRDRKIFEQKYPYFRIEKYEPHTPIAYWLSGGLKWWSLVPRQLTKAIKKIDSLLIDISPRFGSFVDVELLKVRYE
jgi:SAM-dependent methyltransferase